MRAKRAEKIHGEVRSSMSIYVEEILGQAAGR